MQPKDKGFVKIPRCVFSSDIWEERRVFSRFEAIADIYQAADYKSRKLTISFRMLADRWGWCVGKVQRLFATLSKKGMITVVTDGKSTTITVTDTLSDTPTDTPNDTVKHPSIKGLQGATDTPNDTPTDTPSDTPRAYKNDNINISCLSNDSSLRSESTLEEEKDSSLRSEPKKGEAQLIVEFYNKTVADTKLPKCIKLTGKRKKEIAARMHEYGIDKVYEAIQKAAASKFCNGDGPRGWRADIDFIMNTNSFVKILEGKYDDASMGAMLPQLRLNNSTNKFDDMKTW